MKHKGYTLVELLVALPIGAAVLIVIFSSYFAIMQGRAGIAQTSVAIAELDNALHFLAGDLVMAQEATLEAPPKCMLLEWSDYTHWAADEGVIEHSVSYALYDNQLQRIYDGQMTIVARHITYADFSFSDRVFTVTLTSRPGLPDSAVTRTITSEMRTDEIE